MTLPSRLDFGREMRFLSICLVLVAVCAKAEGEPPRSGAELSSEGRSAAAAVTRAYRDAWLANDPAAVMATLTRDAVLLPSGLEPVSGEAAIRRFWWPPDGPPVSITAMEQVIDEIAGSGDVAVVRGHGSLTFSIKRNGRDEVRSQRSTFVNVVRRQGNGTWLMTHRMWSDLK